MDTEKKATVFPVDGWFPNDLLEKSELFADFKAVQEGKVWQTGKSLYQEADIVGEMTEDIHEMLEGRPEGEMRFLKKVE